MNGPLTLTRRPVGEAGQVFSVVRSSSLRARRGLCPPIPMPCVACPAVHTRLVLSLPRRGGSGRAPGAGEQRDRHAVRCSAARTNAEKMSTSVWKVFLPGRGLCTVLCINTGSSTAQGRQGPVFLSAGGTRWWSTRSLI